MYTCSELGAFAVWRGGNEAMVAVGFYFLVGFQARFDFICVINSGWVFAMDVVAVKIWNIVWNARR